MGAECEGNIIEVVRRMDPSNEFLVKDNTLIINGPNSDSEKMFKFCQEQLCIKVSRKRKRNK